MSASKQPARLPAIPYVRTGNQGLDRFIEAVREWIEVRSGARGDTYERALTLRDLSDAGMIRLGVTGGKVALLVQEADGKSYAPATADAFAQQILNSRLFRDLMKSLKDPTRFDLLPQEVQDALLRDIAAEAKLRGADIRTMETVIQDGKRSLALYVEEATAAMGNAAAGVRQTIYAAAEDGRASAGIARQVQGRLDDVQGSEFSIEELLYGNAEYDGVMAQYTLKLSAGGAFAGIGLVAEDNLAGSTTSKLIFVADNVAFVGAGESVGTGPGQIDPSNPPSGRVPFGIDTVNNIIYINGQVRIGLAGPTLDELAAFSGITISASPEVFKVDTSGAAVNASVTLTAARASGVPGPVTWTAGAGSTATPPAPGSTDSWTIAAASQTADAVEYHATVVDGPITYTDTYTVVRLRDGVSALTGMLTNEAATVPATEAGVVTSWAGADGAFRIYRGATLLTTGLVYSVLVNSDGVTATINAANGVYSATAAGTWPNASSSATITLRCVVTNPGGSTTTIDKVFTLAKARTGATGQRGSTRVGAVLASLQRYTGRPGGLAQWSDGTPLNSTNAGGADTVARNAVWAALGNTGTPTNNSHLVLGDEVCMVNALPTTTTTVTGVWDGSAWTVPGVRIDANLLVSGRVAGQSFTGGEYLGALFRTGTTGERIEIIANGVAADAVRFYNSANLPTMSMTSSGISSTGRAASAGATVDIDNSGPSTPIYAVRFTVGNNYGIRGVSSGGVTAELITATGYALALQATGAGAPLRLIPQSTLPAAASIYAGALAMHTTHGLVGCNGIAWYPVQFSGTPVT